MGRPTDLVQYFVTVGFASLPFHGEQDWIVPIAHAHHTASILKNAELLTYPEHGHLSVGAESVTALVNLKAKAGI